MLVDVVVDIEVPSVSVSVPVPVSVSPSVSAEPSSPLHPTNARAKAITHPYARTMPSGYPHPAPL
jgi:hypothetical protein